MGPVLASKIVLRGPILVVHQFFVIWHKPDFTNEILRIQILWMVSWLQKPPSYIPWKFILFILSFSEYKCTDLLAMSCTTGGSAELKFHLMSIFTIPLGTCKEAEAYGAGSHYLHLIKWPERRKIPAQRWLEPQATCSLDTCHRSHALTGMKFSSAFYYSYLIISDFSW